MTEIMMRTGDVIKVGFPMTPSKWIGKPKTKAITRVKMTCGGGIGGSVWYEYVERFPFENINKEKMLVVVRIDGKLICINPKYIVECENFTLVTVKYYTQNPNCGSPFVRENQFIMEDGVKLVVIDEYDKEWIK